MQSIILTATMTNFNAFSSRKRHPVFQRLQKQVWERDNYTCQYCGFQAQEFQEVINVDNNYDRNSMSNMATACVFCTQCFFLESVGDHGYGGGTIIYMPEMVQTEINSLCHVLFCAMENDSGFKDSAQNIYQKLRINSSVVEDKLGEGVSDPAVLGQLIINYKTNQQKDPTPLIKDLRLLPLRSRFKQQIERWAKSAQEETV